MLYNTTNGQTFATSQHLDMLVVLYNMSVAGVRVVEFRSYCPNSITPIWSATLPYCTLYGKCLSVGGEFVVQQVVEFLWARLLVLYNMSLAGIRVVDIGTKLTCLWPGRRPAGPARSIAGFKRNRSDQIRKHFRFLRKAYAKLQRNNRVSQHVTISSSLSATIAQNRWFNRN